MSKDVKGDSQVGEGLRALWRVMAMVMTKSKLRLRDSYCPSGTLYSGKYMWESHTPYGNKAEA